VYFVSGNATESNRIRIRPYSVKSMVHRRRVSLRAASIPACAVSGTWWFGGGLGHCHSAAIDTPCASRPGS